MKQAAKIAAAAMAAAGLWMYGGGSFRFTRQRKAAVQQLI